MCLHLNLLFSRETIETTRSPPQEILADANAPLPITQQHVRRALAAARGPASITHQNRETLTTTSASPPVTPQHDRGALVAARGPSIITHQHDREPLATPYLTTQQNEMSSKMKIIWVGICFIINFFIRFGPLNWYRIA